MSAADNIVSFIRGFGQRKKAADEEHAMKNYLTDPEGTIRAVNDIRPYDAIKLQDDYDQKQQTARDNGAKAFAQVTGYLRTLPEGSDYEAEIDGMSPFLTGTLGMTPDAIARAKAAIKANPGMITALDDEARKAIYKDRYGTTVVPVGAAALKGGKPIYRSPFALRTNVVRSGDGSSSLAVTNPNPAGQMEGDVPAGGAPPAAVTPPGPAPMAPGSFDPATDSGGANVTPPAAPAPAPGLMTPAGLEPFFKAQESGGDYTAVNKTTGALGAHQVMPDTGRALAKRLGLPWRPDMMKRDDPASIRYQDAIGEAARADAIEASGGDPAKAFSYYYSGSPTAYLNPAGNPKTARYVSDMMARIGVSGGGAPTADLAPQAAAPGPGQTTMTARTAPKPPVVKPSARPATAEELARDLPGMTAAMRKPDGTYTNIVKPPAAAKPKAGAGNPIDTYKESKAAIADIRDNLIKLRDDPSLSSATGMYGTVMGYIPGTHAKYIQGLVAQINAQKLVGLATALKASGGNPFSRITNMEAATLPKTLGNFDLNQSPADLRRNIAAAIKQIDALDGRVDAAARRTGILNPTLTEAARPTATNPKTGKKVQWNGKGWVPVGGQ